MLDLRDNSRLHLRIFLPEIQAHDLNISLLRQRVGHQYAAAVRCQHLVLAIHVARWQPSKWRHIHMLQPPLQLLCLRGSHQQGHGDKALAVVLHQPSNGIETLM